MSKLSTRGSIKIIAHSMNNSRQVIKKPSAASLISAEGEKRGENEIYL